MWNMLKAKKWRILQTFLIVGLILSVAVSSFSVVVKSPQSDNAITVGMGQKAITIGMVDVAYAAGTPDYSCDGVDDDIQFQLAINALPANGGKIVILAGNYSFSNNVTRALANVTFQGMGRGSYLALDGVNPIITAGGNNWVFQDLRTDAGSINMGATTGWQWSNVTINATYYAARTPANVGSSWNIPTGRGATLVVAANDATATSKAQADYVADGTADQTEINTAIDAVNAAGGGKVALTNGTFHVSASITMKSAVILEGQSRYGTILRPTANNVTVIAAAAGAGRAGIRDLFIDGAKGTYTGVVGINLNNFDGVLENIEITDIDSYGIYATSLPNWIDWKTVKVATSNTDGIHLEQAWGQTMRGILVGLNGGNGLALSSGGENFLSGILADENTVHGIRLGSESRDQIINSWMGGNTQFGFYAISTDEILFSNNVLFANHDAAADQHQASLWNVDRSSFTNNLLKYQTNMQHGFYAPQHLRDNVFTGNIFDLNGGRAFTFTDAGGSIKTGNTFKANRYKGAGQGVIYVAGGSESSNTFDLTLKSTTLDLSGGASDVEVFFATTPSNLIGYTILYSEASSGDVGVSIRVGRYQNGVALDDDYFDISTSEINKNKGYSKHFIWSDLTNFVIAAGDTVTVGTAGGKVGTGEVIVILQIAEEAG